MHLENGDQGIIVGAVNPIAGLVMGGLVFAAGRIFAPNVSTVAAIAGGG